MGSKILEWFDEGNLFCQIQETFFFALSATLRENKIERLSAASFLNPRKPTGAYSYGACTLKLFTTIIIAVSLKAIVFSNAILFHPCLIFADKAIA
jgi:hypothetical protein